MRVVVDGRYTYETDEPVAIGDRVLLPTAAYLVEVQGKTWEGVVTALTSTYAGRCARILRNMGPVCKPSAISRPLSA